LLTDNYSEKAGGVARIENGKVEGYQVEGSVASSNSADANNGVGRMLGDRPSTVENNGEAAVEIRVNLSDEDRRFLWEVCKTRGTVDTKRNGVERTVGRRHFETASGGDSAKLFRAAQAGYNEFIKELVVFQADTGSAGVNAITKTLKNQDKAEFTKKGSNALSGAVGRAKRSLARQQVRGLIQSGKADEALSAAKSLVAESETALLSLQGAEDLGGTTPAGRKGAMEEHAKEREENLALVKAAEDAVAAQSAKEDSTRKVDANSAGAPEAVCEDESKGKGDHTPANVMQAAIPTYLRPMAERTETYADVEQLKPVTVDPVAAEVKAKWARVQSDKTRLQASWKKAEAAFDDFRVRHYAHFVAYRTPNEACMPGWKYLDAYHHKGRGSLEIAENGTVNVKILRRGALKRLSGTSEAINRADELFISQGRFDSAALKRIDSLEKELLLIEVFISTSAKSVQFPNISLKSLEEDWAPERRFKLAPADVAPDYLY